MDNNGEKDEVKRIRGKRNSSRVSLNGRRNGLFKKAKELGILCGCEIGIIIFSTTGELFRYSNASMNDMISKYYEGVERKAVVKDHATESPSTPGRLTATEEPNLSKGKLASLIPTNSACLAATEEPEMSDFKQERKLLEILTEQVNNIKSRQRPLCKEEEDYVKKLLEMMEEFLVVIRRRTEELSNQKQQQSRLQEMNLLDLFSQTSTPSVSFYGELGLMQMRNSSSTNSNTDIIDNFEADKEDSDTTLQLGLPYRVERKRKEPEKETEFPPCT